MELRLGKIGARLAQDLIGLPELAVFPLQHPQPLARGPQTHIELMTFRFSIGSSYQGLKPPGILARFTYAMQRLHLELLGRLRFDEAHRRPGRCLSYRFGIALVVLLCFRIRADKLRQHQPNFMTHAAQQPAEMMRAAACLHCDYAGGQLRSELRRPVRGWLEATRSVVIR